ncbi:hypothetical protein WN48_03612 [Eufriesea mexicana]|nr:hypothetical protein WN48_03612 [Eufriesea mexicana]
MEFWNFIRNIFGGRNSEYFENRGGHRNILDEDNFEHSIWNIDINDDFRRNRHFNIFSDPLQITQFFESEIENMMKNFIYGFSNAGIDANTNIFSFAPSERQSLRDKMLKSNSDQMGSELDTDLDGKVTADNFSNIWDECKKPEVKLSQPYIIGKSVRKEFVRKADGTVEQKQVIKDYDGNEETIISHQVGDKIHTVVTKKDKNGVETKIEEFSDISECK